MTKAGDAAPTLDPMEDLPHGVRAAVTQPTSGRPRMYCSKRCRQAAFRRSRSIARLVPVDHMETVGTAHGTLPAPAHPEF